jgi:hypothetical protein
VLFLCGYFEYPHVDKVVVGYEDGRKTVFRPESKEYYEIREEILSITKNITVNIRGYKTDWEMLEEKKKSDYVELEFSKPTDIMTKSAHIGTIKNIRAIFIEVREGEAVVFVDCSWSWIWNLYGSEEDTRKLKELI